MKLGPAVTVWTLTFSIALFGAPTLAQQWRIQPAASIGLLYDDNVELATTNPQGSLGSNFAASVTAAHSTGNYSIGTNFGLSRQWYSDVEGLDNWMSALGLFASYASERSRFEVAASFTTQSTLTSEESTTGLSEGVGRQYRLYATPSWSYLLTERFSTDLVLSFEDVLYQGVGADGPADYQAGTIGIAGRYRLTERSGLDALLGYARYSSAGDATVSSSANAQLGATYQLSERLYAGARVGFRSSQTDNSGEVGGSVGERSAGLTYSLTLSRAFERGGGIEIVAGRSPRPSGGAEVLDTTTFGIDINYPVAERVTVGLAGRGYRNRSLNDERQSAGVDYVEGNFVLSYELLRNWAVQIDYRHRWQNDDSEPASAQSNTISVNVAWTTR